MEIIQNDEGEREKYMRVSAFYFHCPKNIFFNDDDYSVKRLVLLGR